MPTPTLNLDALKIVLTPEWALLDHAFGSLTTESADFLHVFCARVVEFKPFAVPVAIDSVFSFLAEPKWLVRRSSEYAQEQNAGENRTATSSYGRGASRGS